MIAPPLAALHCNFDAGLWLNSGCVKSFPLLIHVVRAFVRARDAGQITGAVLVDMSKEFDKVRHQVLINDCLSLA